MYKDITTEFIRKRIRYLLILILWIHNLNEKLFHLEILFEWRSMYYIMHCIYNLLYIIYICIYDIILHIAWYYIIIHVAWLCNIISYVILHIYCIYTYKISKWIIVNLFYGFQKPILLCLAKSLQSCPTLCDLTNCRPPGSSVHGDSSGKNTGVDCQS